MWVESSGVEVDGQLRARRVAARRKEGDAWQARRLEILGIAARLFQRKGFQSTTLKEIADELNLDRATLYRFFASKDELLRACVADSVAEIANDVRTVVHRSGSSAAKLGEIIELVMKFYERRYPRPYVFLYEMLDATWIDDSEWARQLVRQVREIQGLVLGVIEQGMREGEFRSELPADVATNAVLGALNWTSRWYRPGRSHSGEIIGNAYSTLLLQGLRTRPRLGNGA